MVNKKEVLEVLEYKYKQRLQLEHRKYLEKLNIYEEIIKKETEKIKKIILTNNLKGIIKYNIDLKFKEMDYRDEIYCDYLNDIIKQQEKKKKELYINYNKVKETNKLNYENLVNEIKLFGINEELLKVINKF